MTDYSKLIDAETWAFIEKTNSFYPPETVTFTIDQQRAVYNRMCAAFHVDYPASVQAHDSAIPGDRPIPIRIYDCPGTAKPTALVLYYHGGGFVVGGLESHDDVCAEICATTGYRVISVDYRLCPEHVHPAAFDDAYRAFEWAVARYSGPIIVVGDSAGGNIAAAVSHAARVGPRQPAGQVLIYPILGDDFTKGSFVTHAEAPMLTIRDLGFYRDIRTGGKDASGDPTCAPLADKDFSGLPPTVMFPAEYDPLCDDAAAYRDKIRAAGGKAASFIDEGLVHGHLRARHMAKRASDSFARITAAIKALGAMRWPY